MPYAEVHDVRRRIGGRPLNTASTPSESDVTAWLTETEAILNGALLAEGVGQDFESETALSILRSWVTDRVTGLVRMAHAAAGGDGSNDDGKDLVEKFDKLLEDIRDRPGHYSAMLNGGAAAGSARVRSYADLDGAEADDNEPYFTRERAGDQF